MNPTMLQPKFQAFQPLHFGEIRPEGWMQIQLKRDLEQGFTGHLDELVPALIREDDIYGADRLTRQARHKDLGLLAEDPAWQAQLLWWNSETQSNWWDGFVRSALLLGHAQSLEKARAYIAHILSTQDEDGYLGIYAPDLRYRCEGENGELWAQATLCRVLLGYYEATGEPRVLEAVRRAVEVTMRAYPLGRSHLFAVEGDISGVGHGLVLTDVLERLYQITGHAPYLQYAAWLFDEYSAQPLLEQDAQVEHLLDPGYSFQGHGVHTYEHLRPLLVAAYATGDPRLERALAGYLKKLEGCLTPSGGPIGDEKISGRRADAGETGYEYCSIHELLDSYASLQQKTGQARWGDRMEWLLFNAGYGARHPQESAIAYLKTDNSFSMTGPLHPGDRIDPRDPQNRYKYSPAHQDIAVCCVPNAGRILPYYIRSMWLRSHAGLVAALYGACDLRTEVNGVEVRIQEQTDYPFDNGLAFSIEVARPVEFTLSFRKPAWAAGVSLSPSPSSEQADFLHIRRVWHTGERISLRFEAQLAWQPWQQEFILTYGPLLFCLPLEGQRRPGRAYLPGFEDSTYRLIDHAALGLRLGSQAGFSLEREAFDPARPWQALSSLGELVEPSRRGRRTCRFTPLGASILRRVTFQKEER